MDPSQRPPTFLPRPGGGGGGGEHGSDIGSPASSVDSAELQGLLGELHILPSAPAAVPAQPQPAVRPSASKRRLVVDSDSEDGPASPTSSRPLASPRLEGSAADRAAATLRPAPRQQQQQQQQKQPEPEVIDLLDSSSESEVETDEEEEEEDWCIAAPATSQKQRRVLDDSEDEEEEDEEDSTSLPPFFAAIPSLAAQQPPAAAAPPPRQRAAAAPPAKPQQAKPQHHATQPPAASAQQQALATPGKPSRPQSASAFKKQREEHAAQLFREFNRTVFEGRLPAGLEIKWNARLLTTAGLTHYRRDIPDDPYAPPIYTARVELSSKVVDCFAKLERTLCHELCHVAAWLLDHTAKPPHGPVFRRWAERAMGLYTHLDITTCHAYEIFYPYRWQCSNGACLQTYGRHSNSIDVSKKVCGACRCPLTFLGRFKPDGTPAKQRAAPSQYAQFVKREFAAVKAGLPAGATQADVMKKLSELYRARGGTTSSGADSGATGGSSSFGASRSLSQGQGPAGEEDGEGATSPLRGLDLTA